MKLNRQLPLHEKQRIHWVCLVRAVKREKFSHLGTASPNVFALLNKAAILLPRHTLNFLFQVPYVLDGFLQN